MELERAPVSQWPFPILSRRRKRSGYMATSREESERKSNGVVGGWIRCQNRPIRCIVADDDDEQAGLQFSAAPAANAVGLHLFLFCLEVALIEKGVIGIGIEDENPEASWVTPSFIMTNTAIL